MFCKLRINHFENLDCNGDYFLIENLDNHEIDKLLSEIGLIEGSVTRKFQICATHKRVILEHNRLRSLRQKRCSMPVELVAHKGHPPRGDRPLSKGLMTRIHAETGMVVPIGSPICSRCRQQFSLVKEEDCYSEFYVQEPEEKKQKLDCVTTGIMQENENQSTPYNVCESVNSDCLNMESQSSQEFSLASMSQESEASVCVIGKREQLNNFLKMSDVSPVKEKKIPLDQSSEKTGTLCVKKALQCLEAACNIICPGEGETLKQLVFKTVCNLNEKKDPPLLDKTVLILKDIYFKAESWTLQRQILSIIVTDRSFQEVKQIVPDITAWKYSQAKVHSNEVGCGIPVVPIKPKRVKVNPVSLEHFIDYIISSNIVKDLPYGSKSLKLTSGEVVEVPNLIRSLAPSSLVSQYLQFCEAEQISHLASSTLFKILNDCSASVRRCVEGLDYFVSEGSKSFQTLDCIIDKCDWTEEDKTSHKQQLLNGKRYLKADFKVHIDRNTNVGDHCCNFALSGSEKCFSEACDHEHDDICTNCKDLDNILQTVEMKATDSLWQNKEAVLFEVQSSIDCIKEWKAHIMRSRNQEEAKLHLLESIKEGQLFLTCDWAMKFLPRKYREGQTDWFGKRGLNWHIGVTVHKENGHLSTVTHVHIFSSQVSQDASVTSAIITDIADDLRKHVPDFKELHLFSDNAGCYKNTYMMLCLWIKLGSLLKSYNFSEAQDGKGPCDRRASHIKSAIKRFVNEGNDVTCAEEMKKAIDARRMNNIKVKVVDTITVLDSDKTKLKPIPGITQLHNFKFESIGLRVWKAFGIGIGKLLTWESLGNLPEGHELVVRKDWMVLQDVTASFGDKENVETNPTKKRALYDCPKDGCTKMFSTQNALDSHLLLGNCDYNQKMTLHDQAKVMYSSKVNNLVTVTDSITLPCNTQQGVPTIDKGWALKSKRKRAPFSKKQTDFLQEKFNVGKKTGRKLDPYEVLEEMRNIQKGSNYVFSRDEYLTGQQVSSFFSRLALKDRKCNLEDLDAAEEEENKDKIMKDIMKTVSMS